MQPQALVARTTPVFSNFLFKKFIFITFLCFFIISSLFSYFNLFVSIFIQSYVNIKLHVYRYKLHVSTPGFQFRGGAHLKKLRRTEWGAKIVGVFRVKNHDLRQKIIFFPNFRVGGSRVRSPGTAPVLDQGRVFWSPIRTFKMCIASPILVTGSKMCIAFLIIAKDCDTCIQVFGQNPVDRM